MDLGLSGKTAIVTGAGSGIGAAIARRFGHEGAHVVVSDINQESAAAVARDITDAGGSALGVAADVTDEAAVSAMVEQAVEAFGTVHILINNAGLARDGRITKMSESDWDLVVDTGLKGAFLCTRAVLPHMTDQKWGRIISMSSRAHNGNPGQANYSAVKAGLIGFTKAMALENGRNFITANAVAPGMIDTPFVRSHPAYEKIRDNAIKTTPIPRVGEAEDVADAVAFLASERASYITGDVLHVTGGRY
ncbi:SDR family NAD(P)-dependent oxidoreductase [Rhodovulum sp. FJ3]|uniref:SDR family NAD(P)-dependent oxidoreductase n=1 Tax=Rhodovulum sp. FJ3 TaxID=3079053 RepID=UPI00293DCFE2|nr:SDR family NAD(P)-dependent oxidoreductase [Rhodovulum sp. FJ3]MDV4169203.1 SDR family NAD(P)-dependent oxidoreductase [Rhodovulum sp. FJ3]